MNSKKKQDIESTIFQHNWTIFVDIDIRTLIVHIFDHELEQWNMITNRQYFYAYNIYYTLHFVLINSSYTQIDALRTRYEILICFFKNMYQVLIANHSKGLR